MFDAKSRRMSIDVSVDYQLHLAIVVCGSIFYDIEQQTESLCGIYGKVSFIELLPKCGVCEKPGFDLMLCARCHKTA